MRSVLIILYALVAAGKLSGENQDTNQIYRSKSDAKGHATCLKRMRERPLRTYTRGTVSEAYRLTIIPTRGNPISVRVLWEDGKWTVVARRLTGDGGFTLGT